MPEQQIGAGSSTIDVFPTVTFESVKFLSNASEVDYKVRLSKAELSRHLASEIQQLNTVNDADAFFAKHAGAILNTRKDAPFAEIKKFVQLLEKIRTTDRAKYTSLHKGTPFYHLGVLHLAYGRYKEGLEWIDCAFDEDVRNKGFPSSGAIPQSLITPAMHTLSIHPYQGQNDQELTRMLYDGVEETINEIVKKVDRNFRMTGSFLQSLVASKVLIRRSDRSLRASWAAFLGVVMSGRDALTTLKLTAQENQIQLLAHETLVDLTLVLETLLKLYCQNIGQTPRDIYNAVQITAIKKYSAAHNAHFASVYQTLKDKDYATLMTETTRAETQQPTKLLEVSWALACAIRNTDHHALSTNRITADQFEFIFLRLCYTIFETFDRVC